ncbi:MAG: hypothetical protein QE280_05225 [Caulobacter sp.]|jgi:hypothetical protein|nr:hypothetical protein [Caulobacter sp.]
MGAVSIGWAVTLYFTIRAEIAPGASSCPLWGASLAGMIRWVLIDSALSVSTGFGLNVLPNIVLAGGYGVELFGSGVLKFGQPKKCTRGRPLKKTAGHPFHLGAHAARFWDD